MKHRIYLMAFVCLMMALPSFRASAATGLPAVCVDQTLEGKADCPGISYRYDYATDQTLVKSGALWQKLASVTGTVLACGSDVVPGTLVCPTPRVLLTKSALAAPSGVARTFLVTFSWRAPTSDAEGKPLATDAVTGYELHWWRFASASQITTVPVQGLSVALTAPAERVCGYIQALAGIARSVASQSVCIEPKSATPGAPAQVTVTFGAP
jgi:hypothetical protein